MNVSVLAGNWFAAFDQASRIQAVEPDLGELAVHETLVDAAMSRVYASEDALLAAHEKGPEAVKAKLQVALAMARRDAGSDGLTVAWRLVESALQDSHPYEPATLVTPA